MYEEYVRLANLSLGCKGFDVMESSFAVRWRSLILQYYGMALEPLISSYSPQKYRASTPRGKN
jgi:hypothetical protein